mmetsp:Transcript_36782/g.92954  ORF Transcript_36782/g.92954 Transcript_36782/m.92954 type:complete len:333 (-) Transcript_36782:272-1270(-)
MLIACSTDTRPPGGQNAQHERRSPSSTRSAIPISAARPAPRECPVMTTPQSACSFTAAASTPVSRTHSRSLTAESRTPRWAYPPGYVLSSNSRAPALCASPHAASACCQPGAALARKLGAAAAMSSDALAASAMASAASASSAPSSAAAAALPAVALVTFDVSAVTALPNSPPTAKRVASGAAVVIMSVKASCTDAEPRMDRITFCRRRSKATKYGTLPSALFSSCMSRMSSSRIPSLLTMMTRQRAARLSAGALLLPRSASWLRPLRGPYVIFRPVFMGCLANLRRRCIRSKISSLVGSVASRWGACVLAVLGHWPSCSVISWYAWLLSTP